MNRESTFHVGASAVVTTAKGVDAVIVTVRKDDTSGSTMASDGTQVPAVDIGPFPPETAYLLGRALLAAARMNGVGD